MPDKNTSGSSSRKFSTAKLAISPNNTGATSAAGGANDKSKVSVINSVLHSSPSSTSVFTMLSTPPNGPSNTHIMPNRADLDMGIPSFAVDTQDYDLISEVHKHLVSENSLNLPGGDVTRDLYKFTNGELSDSAASSIRSSSGHGTPKARRSSSFSLAERRSSSASGINVPGGFRREYLIKKKKEELRMKDNYTAGEVDLPPFLTRNFMEFLSIYGHFAGESLEDDDFKTCTLGKSVILDEETPLLEPVDHLRTASPMKAFFLLLKSFVGTGILFLPKAFFNGGLLFSLVVLTFFAVYSFWCYYILVQTKDAIKVSSFGDMGQKLFGYKMKFLIIFSIILSQIGFVAAYLVFTSTNLQAFLFNMFEIRLELGHLILVQCMIFIPLSFIRNITKLSLSSLVANFFIFVGLIVIVYYTVQDVLLRGFASDIQQFNSGSWSLFIGVAIFAFEGIGLIIPIQESMIEPQKFPRVLAAVILTVSVLMLIVGALCYSTYGSSTNSVIILNLPQDSVLVNSVQVFYSIAILLSAPLQLFPVIKIIENRVFGKNHSGKVNVQIKWAKNCLRAGLVICCSVIAYAGSANLDKFVSFIGCFACIPLVYMYPPMLHFKAVSKTPKEKFLDSFLVVFGGIAMVYVLMQLL